MRAAKESEEGVQGLARRTGTGHQRASSEGMKARMGAN